MRECGDNINVLARLSIPDLCKRFKGIGEAKAISIMAALELGKRRKTSEVLEQAKITSSVDLFELFEPLLIDLTHEEFLGSFARWSQQSDRNTPVNAGRAATNHC